MNFACVVGKKWRNNCRGIILVRWVDFARFPVCIERECCAKPDEIWVVFVGVRVIDSVNSEKAFMESVL